MALEFLQVTSASAEQSTAIHSTCWKSAGLSDDLATIARSTEGWTCGDGGYSIEGERVLLRFDLGADPLPQQYLFSRRSALEAVHLLAIDQNGAMRQTSLPAEALKSSVRGGYFMAPLPDITSQTRQIVVAFDLPSHRMTLERAYLAPADQSPDPDFLRELLLLALLAGMLSMPLIFNAAFYRILREPFMLWHSALTVSLLATIVVTSGLAVVLFDPAAMTLSWMTTVIFGLTVASGAMFTRTFIEPGRMHPWLRQALLFCALWSVGLSLLHALFPFVARPVQSTLYTAAFAPVIVIFILAVTDALRRGSRTAKFQAIGYVPVILSGIVRLVTGVASSFESNDAMVIFYAGCVFEVLFTTLGVADRFMTLRHQRDQARIEADVQRRLSEHDALTGLFNRRAIEQNFGHYRAEGYRALAVLDLDHFKAINDVHGHGVGDAVLRAVADALRVDPQVQAFRLGGEEFVLLVRGEDAQLRAERLRQTIPAAVAVALPNLGRPVTASMGMTHVPATAEIGFAALYEQADRLLYDAKHAGRNRTKVALAQAREG